MTIAALTLSPAQCISSDTSLLEVAQIMLSKHINHLPVCAGGGYLGIVDIGDILSGIIPTAAHGPHGLAHLKFAGDLHNLLISHVRAFATQKVAEVVNREAPPLDADCPLLEAMLMLSRYDMPLAVVDAQRQVTGMLSSRVLLGYLLQQAEK
ncbi:MAG: CBS domain-containing protein [Burkholderiales bacterium]|nr:CBS domain-containing protein [Burkholderiales bacterium]